MFKFGLNERATLAESGEEGEVIGVAQYAYGNENKYLLRYRDGAGRQVEEWWAESALDKPEAAR